MRDDEKEASTIGLTSVKDPEVRAYSLLVSTPSGVSAYEVPPHGYVTIGRAGECDISIKDTSVSRMHARIHAGTPPILEDLGSMNGTRLSGVVLEPKSRVPLKVGAVLDIGVATILVQRGGTTSHSTSGAANGEHAAPVALVSDPAMQKLYALVEQIGPSPISVIILGETGVGKEVYAETIHRRSARAQRVFLRLNCAAMTESILESELFGYDRGAFTGAQGTKIGLLEAAHEGTLFLDEIGEAPLGTQAKLLRFLESGEVLRLGSVKPRVVDVRIISATNRDLQGMVAEQKFRADLYFRLNGITVTLPPLRDRPTEIVPLAERFVQRASERQKRPIGQLTEAARAALMAYKWPGNVRELKSVVERAVVLTRGPQISAEALLLTPPESRATMPPPVEKAVEKANAMAAAIPAAPDTLPRLGEPEAGGGERAAILDALERAAGNQSRAAKLLGISRRTLVNRLDQFAIPRPRKGVADDE